MTPIEVELPDGTIVEFPEGTDSATMEKALREYSSAPKPAPVVPEARPNAAEGFRSNLQFATPFGTLDTGVQMPEGLSLGLAGAGKSFADTAQGVGQMLGRVPQSEVDERRKLDADLMGTGAGIAGNVAGHVLQTWIPGGAISKGVSVASRGSAAARAAVPFTAAAATGAALAGSQPVSSDETRGGNMAWGGAFGVAGQGVASSLGRLANGIVQSPAVKQAVERARQLGVELSPVQALDSPFLNTVASALNKLPLSGADKLAKTQRADFNRAVSRTFGEDADAIDSAVYASAKARIGGEFNRLSERNALPLSPAIMAQLKGVMQEAGQYGTDDTARAVTAAVDELVSKSVSGVVPGRAYQSLDSKLGKLMKSGGEKAMYLGQVRDAVRLAMDDAISPADQAAWRAAREEYKNLKTVRDLVAKEDGDGISPRALRGRVTASQSGKEAVASGRGGRLAELAKLGQRVSDRVPDSGTAQRLMTYGALGGGGWAAQSENPYVSGLGSLALAAGGGGLAARGLNSPRLARLLVQDRPVLQGVGRRLAPVNARLPMHRASAGVGAAQIGTDQPLEIDIKGGTVGSPAEMAAQDRELEQLRREAEELKSELDRLGIAY